ncbi:MAG: A/G-specific adenine glycosylase [Gammaproteobacteria bacterium]|nr:A/G-specific adenine glycosylase [Gammaproteobacteria bacterium]
MTQHSPGSFSNALLKWFDKHGRKDLPWQENKTSYRVWISEIMLQQTQVKTVIPYYLKFMQHFPDIKTLAHAAQDEVLHLWTGLGYYARARNLHKTAQIITHEHSGRFPQTSKDLQSLPGIGRSTAGAILAFSQGQHQAILDGNVKRVLCRYYCVQGWSGHSKTQAILWAHSEAITPEKRCDDFNQAMMDLGSSLCSRSKPQCTACPLNHSCMAYLNDKVTQYPNPKPKKEKPVKSVYLLMLHTQQGEILLEKRPQQGIWGGLWSFPQCDTKHEIDLWLDRHHFSTDSKKHFQNDFRHTFSHYHLQITPVQIQVEIPSGIMDDKNYIWFNQQKPLKLGLSTPIKKLISEMN